MSFELQKDGFGTGTTEDGVDILDCPDGTTDPIEYWGSGIGRKEVLDAVKEAFNRGRSKGRMDERGDKFKELQDAHSSGFDAGSMAGRYLERSSISRWLFGQQPKTKHDDELTLRSSTIDEIYVSINRGAHLPQGEDTDTDKTKGGE
jgi:hypothetical protein